MSSSASINDIDSGGRTALSWAAQLGDVESIRLLLKNGADPNCQPRGSKSVLLYAASSTTISECVSLLIEQGADPYAQDPVGLTPLMVACFNGRSSYTNLDALLKPSDIEQADINGRTALFHGASTAITPTRMLLDAGCNLRHPDNKGLTALHLAITCKNANAVSTLCKLAPTTTCPSMAAKGFSTTRQSMQTLILSMLYLPANFKTLTLTPKMTLAVPHLISYRIVYRKLRPRSFRLSNDS